MQPGLRRRRADDRHGVERLASATATTARGTPCRSSATVLVKGARARFVGLRFSGSDHLKSLKSFGWISSVWHPGRRVFWCVGRGRGARVCLAHSSRNTTGTAGSAGGAGVQAALGGSNAPTRSARATSGRPAAGRPARRPALARAARWPRRERRDGGRERRRRGREAAAAGARAAAARARAAAARARAAATAACSMRASPTAEFSCRPAELRGRAVQDADDPRHHLRGRLRQGRRGRRVLPLVGRPAGARRGARAASRPQWPRLVLQQQQGLRRACTQPTMCPIYREDADNAGLSHMNAAEPDNWAARAPRPGRTARTARR